MSESLIVNKKEGPDIYFDLQRMNGATVISYEIQERHLVAKQLHNIKRAIFGIHVKLPVFTKQF